MDFIEKAIKGKDINIILANCEKAISKSSVNYFFYNSDTPKKGYVYFLIKNNSVVYIGASSSINRVGAHQQTKDYDCFYYLPCDNYQHWRIETRLIRTFKTKYNCCNVAKKAGHLNCL